MPSTGKTTTASLSDVMITGRPHGNSAKPRSTATCLDEPNRPDFPLALMSPHASLGSSLRRYLGLANVLAVFEECGLAEFIPRVMSFSRRARWQSRLSRISWHAEAGSESGYSTMGDRRLAKRSSRPDVSRDASWAPV